MSNKIYIISEAHKNIKYIIYFNFGEKKYYIDKYTSPKKNFYTSNN